MPAVTMSSQLENTSAILGEYMLKGWTLTDLHCDTCRVTPLMREPDAPAAREGRDRIQFCALCDGGPHGRPSASSSAAAAATLPQPTSSHSSIPTAENLTRGLATASRTDAYISPKSAASAHERAAERISELLLQGYSLLGSICQQQECNGIPLVGLPKREGGPGKRMCVGCGTRYIDERDVDGRMTVLAVPPPPANAKSSGKGKEKAQARSEILGEADSPRTRAKKQLYGLAEPDEEQALDSDLEELEDEEELEAPAPPPKPLSASPSNTLSAALSSTSQSLAKTLDRISKSLDSLLPPPPASADNGRWFVDIKLHTEAIKDVLEVVQRVESASNSHR